eukprot:216239-Prymnesium_polylepis.1
MSGDADVPDALVVEWISHGGDAITTTGRDRPIAAWTSFRTPASIRCHDSSPNHAANLGCST